MKIFSTIVVLLSLSPVAAVGWGRPQPKSLISPATRSITKQGIEADAFRNRDEENDNSLSTRGGAAAESNDAETKRLVRIGDIGNVIVIFLSGYLLQVTIAQLRVLRDKGVECAFNTPELACDAKGVTHPFLDPCYICDGFCISDRTKFWTNSHTLSFIADTIFTIPLLGLVAMLEKDMEGLKLHKYLLSTQKVWGVFGHGCAHLYLATTLPMGGSIAQLSILALMTASAFATPNLLKSLKSTVGIADDEIADKNQAAALRNIVAPFLAPIAMTQAFVAKEASQLLNYAIFTGAAWLFMNAGNPPGVSKVFPVLGAILLFFSSQSLNLGEDDIGVGFVLIFTSAYLYSALAQLLFWKGDDESVDSKEAVGKQYVATTFCSSLMTTLVGWAIAVKCTTLLNIGGHVLYDLSISLSYFLVYFAVKKWVGV